MIPMLAILSVLVNGSSSGPAVPAVQAAPPAIAANDNRKPAGTLVGGRLSVTLEARDGTWYPEGPGSRGLAVAALGEPGQPVQAPGPLIRVRQGTEVRVTLRNTLARSLTFTGLSTSHAAADSVVIAAGAEREVSFVAGTPGTYYYKAQSVAGPFGLRLAEDSQLGGAIVVDPAQGVPRADRVFVLSWWFTLDDKSPTGIGRATMAINGLSWPHTERLDMVQGDSAWWRVVNLTEAEHPMHLHGFYFQVRGKGDGVRDTTYGAAQRRMAVTEVVAPGHTMSLAWRPTRPGNWIFHCHFAGHLSHVTSLETNQGVPDEHALMGHGSDRPHQMYGLVLGLKVAPRGKQVADARVPRPIRLIVRQKGGVYGTHDGYAYVLGGTRAADDPLALPAPPGPTLVLQRGERVAVTIVNQSKERAAVHWHGIELESFPDGVPDWSGHDKEILPSVAPGDSIVVRFTPPRAGTFMYHSHFNEDAQITSGLYGAIVVVEPGTKLNPATDRVMLFSSQGPTTNVIVGPFTPTLLNGRAQPDTMDLRAGVTYRLRMVNITGDVSTIVSLRNGDAPLTWRLVAKDGAALPAAQATARPASLYFDPGEIYDFEFTPTKAGLLTLQFGPPPAPPEAGFPPTINVPVRVR